MADTKEYEVIASSIGVVVGEDRRTGVDIVNYHSRGERVDLDAETAERLLKLTPPAIVDPEAKRKAEERAAKAREAAAEAERLAAEEEVAANEARLQAEAEANEASLRETGADTSSEEQPQRLTEKQALQKEAADLGLDTEGTIPELKERIEAKKAADAAGSGS